MSRWTLLNRLSYILKLVNKHYFFCNTFKWITQNSVIYKNIQSFTLTRCVNVNIIQVKEMLHKVVLIKLYWKAKRSLSGFNDYI